ncbi:MAG TPA: chalcone isomerase family protein [Myxococcota bacterium]
MAIALAAGSAIASEPPLEIEGVVFPPTVQVGGQLLHLNGAGLRRRAIFDVYVAGLYVPQKASSAAALLAQTGPRRVAITMLREVEAGAFSEAVSDGLEANNSAQQLARLKPQIATLLANLEAIGTAREGDAVYFEFTPGAGTRILVNGQQKGSAIPGVELFTAVLRNWLGEEPVDARLKNELLGL